MRTRLARVRVDKGIDRHQLAQATGMTYSSLYRLESGLVKKPPLWWYQNCAIALGVELEEILDYEHSAWLASPQAPRPPAPAWLKELSKEAADKGPPRVAPATDRDRRTRPSGLAE